MKIIKLNLLLMLLSISAFAQQTITITTGPKWTDVLLYKSNKPGQESRETTNYKNAQKIMASAWTTSGHTTFRRTLLKFDLSEIPTDATITSATLYFYSDPAITASNAWNGNSQHSGSNAFYLEKVIQNWNASTVTWNTQPATTTSGRVWVGPSTSTTENLTFDVAGLVQDWVANPASNYGVKMSLQTELRWRARNYISSDHTNSSLHPKLVITYTTSNVEMAYFNRMQYIFGAINGSKVSTGLLKEFGVRLNTVENFDGILRTDNITDITQWRSLYHSLYSMRVSSNVSMPNPATVLDAQIIFKIQILQAYLWPLYVILTININLMLILMVT